jgi:arsenate reductase (thioredoxin)
MDKKKVVFVCTHNAGKSRLAEAYLREIAGDRLESTSAGTEPSDSANPAAVAAGSRAAIELREGPGVRLTPEVAAGADLVVTFGCGVDDWALVDDDGKPLRDYDQIRDAIKGRVENLADGLTDGGETL